MDTTTLQVRVYGSLRESIMEGRFQPGDSFTIRALAAAMGTSVMPVREALSRLLAEGAVGMQLPSRQVWIPVMSRERVAELYRIRIMLEGMATAMAAQHISAEEIQQSEAALQEIRESIALGDEAAFLAANRAFHFSVYRASRSELLLPMIESLWLKLGPLLRLPINPTSRMESRLMEGGQQHHEMLMEGLKRHDINLAKQGLESDIGDAALWFDRNYHPVMPPEAQARGEA
ncbi:MAG: GntR family transcriptional regulator [Phenylobacterium sp.]